jgi:AraC-like DNA-binding protein
VIQSIAVLTPLYVTGFWSIIFLNTSAHRNRAKFFLGFFMVVAFLLYLGHSLFFLGKFEVYICYDAVYIFSSLLVYPMYYQYVRLLTLDQHFKKIYLLHYLPGLILGVTVIFMHPGRGHISDIDLQSYFRRCYNPPLDLKDELIWQQMVYFLHRILFACQVILYFIAGYALIRKYRERILNYYSNHETRNIRWVSNIFVSLVIMSMLSTIFNIIGKFSFYEHEDVLIVPSLLFSGMIFIMGYLANGQDQVIKQIEQSEILEKEMGMAESVQVGDLQAKLELLFREDKIFLNPDLNIWDVSSLMGTNRTYLSGLINKTFNKNFSTYVNHFRVVEAKRLLMSGEMKKYSLEVIGEKCGFGSYNNFIRVFREFEKTTPGRFRERCNQMNK